MYGTTINKTKAMNLEESKEDNMREYQGSKKKGGGNDVTVLQSPKRKKNTKLFFSFLNSFSFCPSSFIYKQMYMGLLYLQHIDNILISSKN